MFVRAAPETLSVLRGKMTSNGRMSGSTDEGVRIMTDERPWAVSPGQTPSVPEAVTAWAEELAQESREREEREKEDAARRDAWQRESERRAAAACLELDKPIILRHLASELGIPVDAPALHALEWRIDENRAIYTDAPDGENLRLGPNGPPTQPLVWRAAVTPGVAIEARVVRHRGGGIALRTSREGDVFRASDETAAKDVVARASFSIAFAGTGTTAMRGLRGLADQIRNDLDKASR